MDGRVTCRPLTLQDDLTQVARLIYYTDEYIFPYLYHDDIDVAVNVITKMIERDTLYNYKNILIALYDDKIVGITVYKKTPIKIDIQAMLDCFIDSAVAVDERFYKTYDGYYKLLNEEPSGIYIANVCVDMAYRRMGVARRMLEFVLSDAENYYLETVKANLIALRLYQSVGFVTEQEYMGFPTIPCCRMKRVAT